MKKINMELDLADIMDKELQLQTLVAESDKGQLAQCIRMISVYVSVYKKLYGELPADTFVDMMADHDMEGGSAAIFASGLSEAISILGMVKDSREPSQPYQVGGITIN